MNNARRKKLEGILEKLEDIQGDLEAIGEEEMDYLSNMPEALQSSERGDRASEATASLEEAWSNGWHWITQPMGEDKRR